MGIVATQPIAAPGCSPSEAALRRIRSRVWTARGKARKARNEHERTDHFHHYLPLGFMAVVGRLRPGVLGRSQARKMCALITNDLTFRSFGECFYVAQTRF
jgi:hypothetical protein